eukprot:symbB.v1.2.030311.t1/scaffold3402.1/size57585/2
MRISKLHLPRWMIWRYFANMIIFVLQRKSLKECLVDCIGCQKCVSRTSESSCICRSFCVILTWIRMA